MSNYLLVIIILVYFGVLFLIALWSDKNVNSKWVNNPYVYSLSLGIYCSAWTYYGSVGIAATSGISFLTTYLGPVIAAPLWVYILRKILRIVKYQKISSIADFIALRYGNHRFIGALVTVICLLGIIPYISLQLKAISETFQIITNETNVKRIFLFEDTTFYIAVLIALFATFFGTQTTDTTDKRRGIVFIVAIESLVKLLIFIVIGVYVTFFIYDGTTDLFQQANASFDVYKLSTISSLTEGVNMFYMIAISFIAIFLLPRQFQMSVVSNDREYHLKTAIWLFPLYLLLFNLFVIYIAWAGNLNFDSSVVNPDYYTLLLPLKYDSFWLALLVFIGGLSAVISMVVVSTVALSNMVSNSLIIPYGFLETFNKNNPEKNTKYIKNIRRFSIFTLIILAYIFYFNFSIEITLFSIGYISFVIIAQLAPAFFIGMFWTKGNSVGAILGICFGFLVVVYTLIVPFIYDAILNSHHFTENGPFGMALLKPYNLFGLNFLTPTTNAFFWSITVNVVMYLVGSVYVKSSYRERNYAELFASNSNDFALFSETAYVWKGEAYVADIRNVLEKFLGTEKTNRAINLFFAKNKIPKNTVKADAKFVNFSEKLLSGIIGSTSSKILISNVVKEQPVSLTEILKILEESKETISTNKFLKEKSDQLTQLTQELKSVNEELVVKDQQKDDFLDTVAHELKTPITAIKASAEVLMFDDDMPADLKQKFLNNIVDDTNRLTKLINNILDLEKLANGREELDISNNNIQETTLKAIHFVEQLVLDKQITIKNNVKSLFFLYDDDRILQVFSNLLTNAIKFVEPVTGQIEINLTEQDDFVLISVEDNGKGIPEEDFEYIFDKFYQSKNQTTKKPVGSGFGLSICKHIVESHKGTIWAEQKSKGVRFLVKLPK